MLHHPKATTAILFLAVVAFVASMAKEGYWQFATITDLQNLIPSNPVLAKVLEGNSQGCLTKPSQTKPVTLTQVRTLRQLTSPDQANTLLGNAYCETSTGLRYLTESGKEINIKFNQFLAHDFSNNNTLTNKRSSNPVMLGGLSTPSLGKPRAKVKS